jgi:hypothetical protein
MTDWRPVRECAPPCETCAHSLVEPQPGADHLLCTHRKVLEAFGRERVAAALAHAEECRGTLHPKFRR